jgi:TolB-like protein
MQSNGCVSIPANGLPQEILAAASRGWRLHPVRARDKAPLVKDWPNAATTDIAQLGEWAGRFPACNWAVATGPESGVFVLDVDGNPGKASLKEFQLQGLEVPETLTVTTGNGRHLYFRCLPEAILKNSTGQLAEGSSFDSGDFTAASVTNHIVDLEVTGPGAFGASHVLPLNEHPLDQILWRRQIAEQMKMIGTEVYERNPSYNPSEDSIVRSEARRLRRKLKEYYESVGKGDSIFIYYRPGSYIPVFRLRLSHDRNGAEKDGDLDEHFVEGRGVRIAVLPFVDASRGNLSGAYARIITDELIHELVRTVGLRVTTASSVAPLMTQVLDLPSLARKLNVQIVFEGTVHEDNNQLRITSRVVNADGFQIWSERFEMEPGLQSLFKISESIVSALISRIRPELSLIRNQKESAGASMLSVYPLVLAAEALLDEGTLSDTQLALSKFQEVTEIEPDYARPVCGIALSYCEMALGGIPNSAVAVSRAKQAAQRAAKLDHQMISVVACTACALALAWEWSDAEKCFQRALGLGESAGTYRQYVLFLAALGRFDEAWNYLQEAHQIDPFSHRQKIVHTKLFHLSRDYEKGVKHVSEYIVYGPLPIESEIYGAMMLILLDRRDEAKQLARSLVCKAGAQASVELLLFCPHQV